MAKIQTRQTNQMPEAVKELWLAEYQRALVYRLGARYGLTYEDKRVVERTIDSLYRRELSLGELESSLKSQLKGKTLDTAALARDIVGFCLLPAQGYFEQAGESLEKYLGGIKQEYADNLEIWKRAREEERAGTYDHDAYLYPQSSISSATPVAAEEEEDDMSLEEKKAGLLTFFSTGLDDLFEIEGGTVLKTINDELIEVLSIEETFKKDLEDLLLASKLMIGDRDISLDDKPVKPTAANWLKDFFKVAGTEYFDTLTIAKYILASDNAKQLSETDQAKLRRFLALYHNIHLFPAPFSAMPVEQWHILPNIQEAPVEPAFRAAPAPASPASPAPMRAQSASEPKATPAPAPTISKPPPKEDSPEVAELKNLLAQYPEGSLERAAVEEELRRLTS